MKRIREIATKVPLYHFCSMVIYFFLFFFYSFIFFCCALRCCCLVFSHFLRARKVGFNLILMPLLGLFLAFPFIHLFMYVYLYLYLYLCIYVCMCVCACVVFKFFAQTLHNFLLLRCISFGINGTACPLWQTIFPHIPLYTCVYFVHLCMDVCGCVRSLFLIFYQN